MSHFGEEQLQFFETWLKIVFDEAVHVSPEGGAWGGSDYKMGCFRIMMLAQSKCCPSLCLDALDPYSA